MLSSQYLRENKSYVDRFFFYGGEDINDHIHKTNNIHPQCKTHIQLYRKRGTERVVVLCGKGIPKKDDKENAERYGLCILMLFKPWKTVQDLRENNNSWAIACQAFLNSPYLSLCLKSIIYNIELLHRCSEKTELDKELRKNAIKNPMLAKACHIDCSVPGYDADDDLFFSNTYINLPYDAYKNTSLNIIPIEENIDYLEHFASDLNDEQRKAYFLFCNHHQRNSLMSDKKLSQLLLFLTGAGGTGKSRVINAICSYFEYTLQHDTLIVLAPTGIAATNICGNTIYSACGFGFGEYENKQSNSSEESLRQLQEH